MKKFYTSIVIIVLLTLFLQDNNNYFVKSNIKKISVSEDMSTLLLQDTIILNTTPTPTPTPSSSIVKIQLYENTQGIKLDGYTTGDVVITESTPTITAINAIGMTLEQVSNWSFLNLGKNVKLYDTTQCYGKQFIPGTVAIQDPSPGSLIPNDFDPVTTYSTASLAVWIEGYDCIYE